MQSIIGINHLSREEKLRVMEALWDDLSRENGDVESPDWHQKVLRETEGRFSSGQEETIDWQVAKKLFKAKEII